MFDSKKSITARLTDSADLLIDFATLGEYGLEPVGRTTRACEADSRPPLSRQSRDTNCAPSTRQPRRPGDTSLFSTVAADSPYADILHGPRRKTVRPVRQGKKALSTSGLR
ncbi:MAG TPA: hypothetical protein VFX45_04455 [Solirubrobacterales bacterium]|nr:hypothetical protein [Solirubrobacterales bacterium]